LRTSAGFFRAEISADRHLSDIGIQSVERMRIVVVFPAPFGPKSPKISPLPIVKTPRHRFITI